LLTRRLYYHDSYLQRFDAQAVSVSEDGLRVVLDRSAFYPTSGGQPHDTGTLNGIPVLDVVDEDDRVVHVLSAPLIIGPVHGQLDWSRRLDHMQQHSGQHLLSAVAAEEFGLTTVSVHMGPGACTIDVEGATPGKDWLAQLERRANEQIYSNRLLSVSFEDAQSAQGLRKPSDRTGTLRIVSIAGLDRSACGGTHVRHTAEIGALLLGRTEKVRQALRVEFRCGLRVLEEARRRATLCEELQARLSEADKSARKALLELASWEGKELYRSTGPNAQGLRLWTGTVDAFDDAARAKLSAFISSAGALAVLSDPNKSSLYFAASPELGIHCGKKLQALLAEVGGKGGGGPQMAQGSVPDAALLNSIAVRLLEESATT
jgi:alanyl-tRNA synthetase